jgi:hypothetical protein
MSLPSAGSLSVGTGGLTIGTGGSAGISGTGDLVVNGNLQYLVVVSQHITIIC